MYHRPSSVGGDAVNVARPRSLQNENSHLSTNKASDTTTPAKSLSRPRRAFGDISNKKAQDKGASASKQQLALKPRSSNAFTPSSNGGNGQQFQSRIPKTAGGSSKQTLNKRSHPWSKGGKGAALNVPRQVDFILPISSARPVQDSQSKDPETTLVVGAKTATPQVKTLGPIDDVELPAGRLWVEQLQHDDPLGENDDLSTSSMGETLDRRTMWDDWRDTMIRQWEEERAEQDIADEREVQAQLEKILRDEEHGMSMLIAGTKSVWINQSHFTAYI